MRLMSIAFGGLLTASVLSLTGCGSGEAPPAPAADVEPSAEVPSAASAFPASLPVVGNGYPVGGAPCRQLGESEATVDWLDDSATLVGCPTRENARELGGRIVGVIDGITLVSVPMGNANAGMSDTSAEAPAAKATKTVAAKDVIRGKGGLEEKCHARLAREVGAPVIGTNRIEESEAAIAIYVNMRGAQAPWRCLGYKDGTIGEVMYTGSEGAL